MKKEDKVKIPFYLSKEVVERLTDEIRKRDRLYGAQSAIVEEALREKFGMPAKES